MLRNEMMELKNEMMELKEGLRRVPFLESLEDSQIDYLVKIGKRVPLNNRELLFRKGDPGRCMYVILEGRIQIYMESSDGQAAVLRVLESSPSIPALVEYDYLGLRSTVDEVRTCLDYVRASQPGAF